MGFPPALEAIFAMAWTSLVHLSQAKNGFFEIVRGDRYEKHKKTGKGTVHWADARQSCNLKKKTMWPRMNADDTDF
jgi:hypothetical protein